MSEITVTVVLPVFNEAAFLSRTLSDIAAQSFPAQQMEVLVIDGASTDATPKIARDWAGKCPLRLVLVNPRRTVPHAMNLGIKRARGRILVRLDAHASYPPDYIESLVAWLERTGADNVGGVIVTKPRADTSKARAIARVLSHRLGVGNSVFRLGSSEPLEVDTVPFGCYRMSVFDRYGSFNEDLERNQDIELNRRIRRQGGRVLLVPDVTCDYFARSTWKSLASNGFQNGRWVLLTAVYSGQWNSLGLRHFVPGTAVVFGLATLALVFLKPALAAACLLPVAVYVTMVAAASVSVARRSSGAIRAIDVGIAFGLLHLCYGLGSIAGIPRAIGVGTRRLVQRLVAKPAVAS